MPKYEVTIIYKGTTTYILEADSPSSAEELAETRFKEASEEGLTHTVSDAEWIDYTRCAVLVDPTGA